MTLYHILINRYHNKKMQIDTIMSCHFLHIRCKSKCLRTHSVDKAVGKPHILLLGMQNDTTPMEKNLTISSTIRYGFVLDPIISLLGTYSPPLHPPPPPSKNTSKNTRSSACKAIYGSTLCNNKRLLHMPAIKKPIE